MKHTPLKLSTLAFSALLAACGGGDSASDTPGATRGSDFASLEQCIVNRWEMGAEQLQRGMETVAGSSASGVSFSVSGSAISEFSSGGAYKGQPAYTVHFSRGGTNGTTKYAGTAQGTWSLSGDRLTIARTSSSVTVTQTIGGVSNSYTDPVGAPSTVKVVSCTPATLTYDQTLPSGAVVRIVLVSA